MEPPRYWGGNAKRPTGAHHQGQAAMEPPRYWGGNSSLKLVPSTRDFVHLSELWAVSAKKACAIQLSKCS